MMHLGGLAKEKKGENFSFFFGEEGGSFSKHYTTKLSADKVLVTVPNISRHENILFHVYLNLKQYIKILSIHIFSN